MPAAKTKGIHSQVPVGWGRPDRNGLRGEEKQARTRRGEEENAEKPLEVKKKNKKINRPMVTKVRTRDQTNHKPQFPKFVEIIIT